MTAKFTFTPHPLAPNALRDFKAGTATMFYGGSESGRSSFVSSMMKKALADGKQIVFMDFEAQFDKMPEADQAGFMIGSERL